MQYITVRPTITDGNVPNEKTLYRTCHDRNEVYLERENEPGKFQILGGVDDTSPTSIWNNDLCLKLMRDLEIVLDEAKANGDEGMCNHLKEIFVLCKLCLWNEGELHLVFSPWGFPSDEYPIDIPEKYRFNISKL